MAKRRRASSSAETSRNGTIRSKRTKFTLVDAKVPEVLEKAQVLVVGTGDVGQLGLGPDITEKSRPALLQLDEHEITTISAGGMHTVCLSREGVVITFGCNDEGALGRTVASEEGEFEPGIVDLPQKAIQVSAGDSHSACLLEDGSVYAWGTFRDSHGNMGLTPDGNERTPFKLSGDIHVVQLASGGDHIVMLSNKGEVYTCGCAEQGQLGRTTERSGNRNARGGKRHLDTLLQPGKITAKVSLRLHFDRIWAGAYGTFAKVADSDEVYIFGLNNYNQLGTHTNGLSQFTPKLSDEFSKHKWAMIAVAPHHTLALDETGRTFVIGRKEYGRLGLGKDCDDALTLVEIPKLMGQKVVYIACGSCTSFAVTLNGDLYGWGMGTNGQLGTGNDDDYYEPTLIKSKQLQDKMVVAVSSGGQHTIMLATSSCTDLNPTTEPTLNNRNKTEENHVDQSAKSFDTD